MACCVWQLASGVGMCAGLCLPSLFVLVLPQGVGGKNWMLINRLDPAKRTGRMVV